MSDYGSGFWVAVLEDMGLPGASLDNSIAVLTKWQPFEGGTAAFNPLNTTLKVAGSTNYNSAGVQNYPNQSMGEWATAKTLDNGYYPSIVAALKANDPINLWSVHPIPAEVDTWGTHGFAAYLRTLSVLPGDIVKATLFQAPDNTIYIFVPTGRGAFIPLSSPTLVEGLTADWGLSAAIPIDAASLAAWRAAYPNPSFTTSGSGTV